MIDTVIYEPVEVPIYAVVMGVLFGLAVLTYFWPSWLKKAEKKNKKNALLLLFFGLAVGLVGSDKPIIEAKKGLFRFLFHAVEKPWQLAQTSAAVNIASNRIDAAEATFDAVADVATNTAVEYISFDWHVPNRLVDDGRQNVMAWTVQVVPANINDVLFEDHYVAFNATASTNPAVIVIDYAVTNPTGGVEHISANVIASSYPDLIPVTVASGIHSCYWYRVQVPEAFVNSVRDWNGEALFGAPPDRGGFDIQGTLVVDDGDNVWIGRTDDIDLGDGSYLSITNGIVIGVTNE